MLVLAIDTAGPDCAACLYDGGRARVIAEYSETIGKGHAERLMPVIAAVLEAGGLAYADIDRLAVTTGPGSFTGIRVGIAAARGFALALKRPLAGISTLRAIAEFTRNEEGRLQTERLAVFLAAGRGEVYGRLDFDSPFAEAGQPFIAPVDDLAETPVFDKADIAFCGNGAEAVIAASGCNGRLLNRLAAAPVATVAQMGAAATDLGRRAEPLYLRRPDAKPQTGFAVATRPVADSA